MIYEVTSRTEGDLGSTAGASPRPVR